MNNPPQTIEEAEKLYRPKPEIEHDMANCRLCRMEQVALAKRRLEE